MKKDKYLIVKIDEELYDKFNSYLERNLLSGGAVVRHLIQNEVNTQSILCRRVTPSPEAPTSSCKKKYQSKEDLSRQSRVSRNCIKVI